MSLFEILRISILALGWPFLIFGSIFIFIRQLVFNKKLNQPILGKIMLISAVALFVTMYSLGITATLLMFQNLNLGVKVVLPIFIIWFTTMIVLIKIIKNWNSEVLIRQKFYNKLTEGIKDIIDGDLNFRMPAEKSEHYEIKINTGMFNNMMEELKRRDEFMKETRKREKEINRMKSEFISIAAHQLRTPLSAVKWVFSILISEDAGKVNEEQKEMLVSGKAATEKMIALVNDLLNVSRIEEGRFEYHFTKSSLVDILNKVIKLEQNKIKEKQINFSFTPFKKNLTVKIDEEKIFLVFQNIIENALNYTPKNGGVTVSLKYGGGFALIEVEDNGVGIPKKQMTKLFDKFARGENVMRMQTEGTGLGLFISKNIVERHGGKIKIESEESKGTKVSILLPVNGTEPRLTN